MRPDQRPATTAPVRTVFLGSGTFAVPILDTLVAAPEVRLVGAVTAPDRPAGRHGIPTAVPIARRARDLGLPLLQPARLRDPDGVAGIRALAPELGVVADYGQIVPPSILELPRHGLLNLHPSRLPRHRGATPIPATIEAGDPLAGITVIRMDEGMDTGPIVAQETWPLHGTETAETLEAEAAGRAAALLLRTLGPWLAGEVEARPQPESGATTTRPLRRADGRLDPTRTAAELERSIRAHVPWPGSFVDTALGRLIVHRASVAQGEAGDLPGTVVANDDGLALVAADGRLRLDRVQLAGRRPADGAAVRRGTPALVGQSVALR